MKHCINKSSQEFKDLLDSTGLSPNILAAKIAVWQSNNKTLNFPKGADVLGIAKTSTILDKLAIMDSINNKIVKPDNSIEKDKYKLESKLYNRGSHLAQIEKEKKFPWLKGKSDKTVKSTEGADIGTLFHNDVEYWINEILGRKQTTKLLNPNKVQAKIRKFAQSVIDAFPEGTEFRTEITVVNKERKYASTGDLIAVLPDGSAINVDYKTTNAYRDSKGNIEKERLEAASEYQYKYQAKLTEEALMSNTYGFEKAGSVMIPVVTTTKKIGQRVVLDDVEFSEIQPFYPENSLFYNKTDEAVLSLIASDNYLKSDESIKSIVEAIDKRIKIIRESQNAEGDRVTNAEQRNIKNLIIGRLQASKDAVIFNKDFSVLLNSIDKELKFFISKYGKTITLRDKTIPELDTITAELNSLREVSSFYVKLAFGELEIPDDLKPLKNDIAVASAELSEKVQKLSTNIINELADRENTDRLNVVQQPQGHLSKLMRTLGEIDHSMFELFFRMTNQIEAKIAREFNEFSKELVKLNDAFIPLAIKKGKTAKNYFSLLMDGEDVIKKWDWAKFKKDWEENKDNKKWLDENLVLKPDAVKHYKDNYNQAVKLAEFYYDRNKDKLGTKIMELDARNPELSSSRSDPSSIYYNPSDNYFTKEYRALEKPARDYIDFYAKATIFSQRVLGEQYNGHKMWYVENGYVDNLFQNGLTNPLIGINKWFTEDIENPDPKDREITINGEVKYSMPKRFIIKKENVTYSNDLSKILSVVYLQSLRNKYFSEIEHLSGLMIDKITDVKVVGKDILGRSTNTENGVEPEAGIKDAFRDFVNFHVYDVKSKHIMHPVAEQCVKRITKLITANIVGLSTLANAVNAISNTVNLTIEAKSGKHITTKSVTRATKEMISDKKAQSILSLLDLDEGRTYKEKINKLSTQGKVGNRSLKNIITLDTAFKGMRYPEEGIKNLVALAFLHDNTIINNKIVRLTPEVAKTNKSVFEMMSLGKDGIEMSDELANDDFYMLTRIRTAIAQLSMNITGSLNNEDIRRINLTIAGNQLMMFKNWIPRLYDVRFGEFRRQKVFDSYSVGRYRSLLDGIFQDKNKYKKLKDDIEGDSYKYSTGEESEKSTGIHMLKMITFGLVNLVVSYADWLAMSKLNKGAILNENFKRGYAKFKAEHPEMSDITEEEYVRIRMAGMNANFIEMSILLAFAVILLSLGGDDDKKDPAKQALITLLNRISAELTFFIMPGSFKTITHGDIFPLVGFGDKIARGIGNLYDYTVLEEGRTKGDPARNLKKMIFPFNGYYSFEYWFNREAYDELTFKVKKEKKEGN